MSHKATQPIRNALRRGFRRTGCAVCVLTLGAGAAHSAEYVIQPSVSSRLAQNDNLLLGTDGREVETFILEVSPRVEISRSTEKWQALLDAEVSAVRIEDDEFDSDNQNVSIQLTRRAETLMFQFVALNQRESTRLFELNEFGEPAFDIDRRDRQFARPSVTWTINTTNQLAVGVSGENLHYGGTQFSDYDVLSADIGWTHQYDEKTQIEVSTFGSEFTSVPPFARVDDFLTCVFGFDGIDEFGSETVGVQVGASRQASNRLRYRGSLGYRDVKNRNERQCIEIDGSLRIIESTASNEGFVLDTGLNYQGEKYGVDVSLSRSVTPVGLGFLSEQDNFRLNFTYRHSETITGTLLLSGFSSESLDETFLFEREGYRIAPRLGWRVNEQLSVNGGLVYRVNDTIQNPGDRSGLSTYVGFQYNFKPKRFTR